MSIVNPLQLLPLLSLLSHTFPLVNSNTFWLILTLNSNISTKIGKKRLIVYSQRILILKSTLHTANWLHSHFLVTYKIEVCLSCWIWVKGYLYNCAKCSPSACFFGRHTRAVVSIQYVLIPIRKAEPPKKQILASSWRSCPFGFCDTSQIPQGQKEPCLKPKFNRNSIFLSYLKGSKPNKKAYE